MFVLKALAVGVLTQAVSSEVLEVDDVKKPWEHGLICNYESYLSDRGPITLKYLCVPSHVCKNNTFRSPAMPYDRCGTDLLKLGPEHFVCCHPHDITDSNFKKSAGEAYMPGVRSFMKCIEYGHLVCRGTNVSLCYKDMANFGDRIENGERTSLNKHPYLALIGHIEDDSDARYDWYCRGTIVSETHILTAASCDTHKLILGTHVKVGEEHFCQLCSEWPEEQTIKIKHVFKFPRYNDFHYYYDIAVVELEEKIVFNRFVRPACIFTDPNDFHNRSVFAGYGKNEKGLNDVMTPANDPNPVYFMVPAGDTITFWLQAVSDAVVTLTSTGRPSDSLHWAQVVIGSNDNNRSSIRVNLEGDKVAKDTPGILNKYTKKFYWIRHNASGDIEFGNTLGRVNPLLTWKNPKPYNITDYGVSTPGAFGADWSVETPATGFIPNEVDLNLSYKDKCLPFYKSDEALNGDQKLYDHLMFCGSKADGADGLCFYDLGGAAVVQARKPYCMWHVVGVLAKDVQNPQWCEHLLKRPSIFTRVATFHLNWLETIVWGKNFTSVGLRLWPPACAVNIGNPKIPGQCRM